MTPLHFLKAELEHAQHHLARVRRIQAQMQQHLEAAGLDEVTVYQRLVTNPAHRQLQRDELFYQQMWLRIHRQLERHPASLPQTQAATVPTPESTTFEDALAARHAAAPATAPKPIPFRKPPTPGPNQLCLCGSNIKYKKCCGNPLLPR